MDDVTDTEYALRKAEGRIAALEAEMARLKGIEKHWEHWMETRYNPTAEMCRELRDEVKRLRGGLEEIVDRAFREGPPIPDDVLAAIRKARALLEKTDG